MTKTSSPFSTAKIIGFLLLLCVALMSAVMIFHAMNKPKATPVAVEGTLVFPVARDIKNFTLATANDQKFTLQNFLNHWTLVFFGFTHCASVCPTTLEMMKRAYPALHNEFSNLQIVLISLDPERDNPEALAAYTRNFHPDFIGVSGKLQELRKMQSNFGIFSAKDNNSPVNNYQLQHTASIMLVNPQGKWAALYQFGMNPQQFTEAVKKTINAIK